MMNRPSRAWTGPARHGPTMMLFDALFLKGFFSTGVDYMVKKTIYVPSATSKKIKSFRDITLFKTPI